MNHTPVIRSANHDDIPFIVASNQAMATETEDKQLNHQQLTAGVSAVLDRASHGFYLVASHHDKPIGCLLVTYEWSDWRNGAFWWIQSVYVVPEARRQGIFRQLYTEVKQRAAAAGAVGLRLYVEIENVRAQKTYVSLGMHRCRYHMYEMEFNDTSVAER